MWCPNRDCSHRADAGHAAEYREGYKVCSNCSTVLVEEEPKDRVVARYVEIVTVARFRDVESAYLFRGALEWRGVRTYVLDDQLIWMNWMYSLAIGGVRVVVREADLDQARQVMNDDWDAQPEEAETGPWEPCFPPCPVCSAADASRRHLSSLVVVLAVLGVFVLGPIGFAALLLPNATRVCENCGATWTPEWDDMA